MSARIRINPMATSDLHEIKSYIAEDSIDASIEMVAAILRKIEQLADFPAIGTKLTQKIGL